MATFLLPFCPSQLLERKEESERLFRLDWRAVGNRAARRLVHSLSRRCDRTWSHWTHQQLFWRFFCRGHSVRLLRIYLEHWSLRSKELLEGEEASERSLR